MPIPFERLNKVLKNRFEQKEYKKSIKKFEIFLPLINKIFLDS